MEWCEEFEHFGFDLIYSFDETMPPDAWYHMMESFCQSPRCKFLISFRTLKVKPGNTEAFQSMLEDYDLHFLHDILVYMKCSNKACHAGFHIKQSVKDGKPAAINHLSHQEINPIWSDCHNFWSSQELAFKSLDEIIVRIDEHQNRNMKTRKERKQKKISD